MHGKCTMGRDITTDKEAARYENTIVHYRLVVWVGFFDGQDDP